MVDRLWNNKPEFSKRGTPEDKRVSTCTDCRYGIFKGQEYVWARDRGLVHTACQTQEWTDETKNAERAL